MNRLVLSLLLASCAVLAVCSGMKMNLTMETGSKETYYKQNGRRNKLAQVEVGVGAFKPDIEVYPENFFEKRLKYLLKLKEKKEKSKKKPK